MSDNALNRPLADADDPLLAALLFFSRRFGRPVSAEQLLRGLPLDKGKLTPETFAEAASRGSMVAREAPLTPMTMTPLALPAVALTEEGDAIAILTRREGRVLIAWPRSGDETMWVPLIALTERVKLRGFFIRGQLYFDGRSQLYEPTKTRDWFWGPMRANAWIYVVAAAASLITNVAASIATMYVMAVYDRVIPNRSMDTLAVLTTGVVALYLLDLALKVLRGHLIDAASRRFDAQIGARVFAKVLALQPAGRPQSAGTLANTVREFDSLRDFFTSATLTVLGDVPFLVIFIALMGWFAGPVALVPLVAIPIVLGLALAFLWPLGRLTDQSYREGAQRNALLYEVVQGLDTLRGIGAQSWARRRWDALLEQNVETLSKVRELGHFSQHLTALVQALVGVGVIVAASLLVADGKLSTGAMVACSMLAGRAIAPLAALSGLIGRIHATRASLASLDKLMQAPDEDESDATRLHVARFTGGIGFRNVSFTYPEQGFGPNRDQVLAGIELDIAPGEHVALIGRVGSGKSSLMGLLVNLYQPVQGHVVVDGIDVRQIALTDLRANVGFVSQEAFLFHGTVRENITMGYVGASDAQVLEAARVACLEDLLAYTADGLNMQVGEGGRRLSGGMRQAVTIARAMVSDPPILLLDEPTSNMDQTTERAFLERLKQARQGKTTLLVTHRPAVLAIVDRVIVIERGKVVADGPKDQVLAALMRRDQ